MQCWQPQVSDDIDPTAQNGHAQVHVQQQQHHPPAPVSATHGDAQQQQQRQLNQQQHTSFCSPVEAWQHGKLTLGFSGGGFLLPYHLGVFHSLAKMGIVSTATPMAGSSAGSLVVGGIKSGLTLQQQMDSFMEAAHACREGGVNGRLRSVLKEQLFKTMPADAAERCSDGTCWISVTQVFPRPANKLYGAFISRQQLVKALLASCHLPRLSDGGLFTSYKSVHKRVFDGGFSNLCPVPPVTHISSHSRALHTDGQSNTQTTVIAAAAGDSADRTSSSGSGEPHPTAAAAAALLLHRTDSTKGITTKLLPSKPKHKQLSSSAVGSSSSGRGVSSSSGRGIIYRRTLSAPEEGQHPELAQHSVQFSNRSNSINEGSSSHTGHHRGVRLQQHQHQLGMWARRRHELQAEQQLAASCEVEGPGAYVDAQGWFAVRVCVLPARSMHQFPAMFRAPAADEVAIALDKFQDWPHDLNATTALALYPQDDDFLWGLFKRGQDDAAAWAQQQGFPSEVLARLNDTAAEPAMLRVVRSSSGGDGREGQQGQHKAAAAAAVAAQQGLQEVRQVMQAQRG